MGLGGGERRAWRGGFAEGATWSKELSYSDSEATARALTIHTLGHNGLAWSTIHRPQTPESIQFHPGVDLGSQHGEG